MCFLHLFVKTEGSALGCWRERGVRSMNWLSSGSQRQAKVSGQGVVVMNVDPMAS
jgi:hypothetical protein